MGIVLIDYRVISWGGPDEDDNNDVWALEDSSSDPDSVSLWNASVGDPVDYFQAPGTLSPGGNEVAFVFWNATNGTDALSGYPSADPQRILTIPPQPDGTIVYATAWYAPPAGPGTGKQLRARTFDIDLNGFRKETPILSTTPGVAWPGPNSHNVSTEAAAASATAKAKLLYPAAMSSQPPGEASKQLKYWQPVAGGPPTVNATTVSCPQGKSALVLAFFGHSAAHRAVNMSQAYRAEDYWGEFWGKRGAEGVGPFGPNGPGGPWGPRLGHLIAVLPSGLMSQLEGQAASLQLIVEKLGQRER